MPSCLGQSPRGQDRPRVRNAFLRVIIGLALTALAVSLSYNLDSLRAHYPGATSFTPMAFICTIVLSPLWLLIHLIALRFFQWPGRSIVAILIPSTFLALISLRIIWHTSHSFYYWE